MTLIEGLLITIYINYYYDFNICTSFLILFNFYIITNLENTNLENTNKNLDYLNEKCMIINGFNETYKKSLNH